MIEIRVKVKNESKSQSYKELIYDNCNPQDDHDPVIMRIVDESVKSFGEDPEKVSYSLHKVIQ